MSNWHEVLLWVTAWCIFVGVTGGFFLARWLHKDES